MHVCASVHIAQRFRIPEGGVTGSCEPTQVFCKSSTLRAFLQPLLV